MKSDGDIMSDVFDYKTVEVKRIHPLAIACFVVGLSFPPVMYLLSWVLRLWQYGLFMDVLTFMLPVLMTFVLGRCAVKSMSEKPNNWRGKVLVRLGMVLCLFWEGILFMITLARIGIS